MKIYDSNFIDSAWPYVLGGICILMLPITIYHAWRYSLNRHHVVYKYRYSDIVIYESIFFVMQLIWTSIQSILVWSILGYPSQRINNIVFNVCISIQQVLRYILIYLWIYRFWMLFYDIKLIVEISNDQWRKIILENYKNGWFLSHKHTFGNKKFILFQIILPLIIISCLSFIVPNIWACIIDCQQMDPGSHSWLIVYSFAVLIVFIPTFLLCIIYSLIPSFNDDFYVLKELKYIFIVLFIESIFNLSDYIYALINEPYDYILSPALGEVTAITCEFIAILISTFYVNIKVRKIVIENKYIIKQVTVKDIEDIDGSLSIKNDSSFVKSSGNKVSLIEYYEDDDCNDQDSFNIADVIHDDINVIPLFEVLCYSISYSVFMKHLSTEFNIECLLSLTEFIQFQQLILAYIDKHHIKDYNNTSNKISLFKTLKFADSIPKSNIVYNQKSISDYLKLNKKTFYNECKEKAYQLYEKYIKVGCNLEINIDYNSRKKLKRLMDNKYGEWMNLNQSKMDLIELMYLFEKSSGEMYILMSDSYQRFIKTHHYKKLDKLIFIN